MDLQPCDWHEHDVQGRYVVDVFGRTNNGLVACVRIHGFQPYFYVKSAEMPNTQRVYDDINKRWVSKYGENIGQEDYAFNLSKKVPEYKGISATRVKKYDVFAGFSDLEQVQVWKVACGSLAAFRSAKTHVKGLQYESNMPPFLRLFHDRHLGPASPLHLEEFDECVIPLDENDCQLYFVDAFYECHVSFVTASQVNIPMLIASYDLEMYSVSGMFPQAAKDPIIQIGISYRWSNAMLKPSGRVVFVLGSVDKSEDPGVEFISCENETDLLRKFQEEIQTENPDILCGYNIFGFDDGYIEGRCAALGLTQEFDLSRKRAERNEKVYESKKFELASGKYDLRFMTLRGRLGLDLLLNMRREHSLSSFKLDSVASVFLRDKIIDYKDGRISTKSTRGLSVGNFVRFDIVGNTTDPYRDGAKYEVTSVDGKGFTISQAGGLFADLSDKDRKSLEWTFTKDDVDAQELFRLHARGGSAGRARIAKYCIQDCDLVLTLMAKLDTIVNARGMADVCKVPMEYVLRRGQGIKIFSAVVYYASQRDQILQVQPALEGDGGYEGAIVISPKIGMYLDQPISVLDFNSLYPTNMIAYNLSPDTLVLERVMDADGYLLSPSKEVYEKIKTQIQDWKAKGYVFEDIEYDNKDEKDVVVSKTICTYVQASSNPMTVGVLPKTLDILLKKRKEFKEKMEDKQYDEAQRGVYNGLQLAYKVVANSVYGQCGSRTSPIRKLCVAACTTAAGRKMLHFAKKIVETEYGATVIYGDSVASYTPVTVRKNGQLYIQSIEELSAGAVWRTTEDGEKEYCELDGVESWTEKGWTPMYRIIRHALAPHKKMVRVTYSSSSDHATIDVTDDHSLIRADLSPVRPVDLRIGDMLLCGDKDETLTVVELEIGIPYTGYVYDLTTENHHFQAGGLGLIVHNTDSIFIQFPTKELVESIKMGIEAGKRISLLSRQPYKIAYEKTFYPFILFCRKRYVGMMYEEDANAKPKRKEMGIVLKRRDNAPIVKDVFGGALDMLLQEKDVKKAQKFVNEMLIKVLENRLPLEKFIISKSLRDDYTNPDQIAHRVLADRMERRDPGTAPKVGDRIAYIYVSENKAASKQGDKIEEVEYVRKQGLKPDALLYVKNQIQNPVAQLFALCIEDLEGYVPPKRETYKELYARYLERYEGDKKEEEATLRVLADKEKQLESMMFLSSPKLKGLVSELNRKVYVSHVKGPMDTFIKKK